MATDTKSKTIASRTIDFFRRASSGALRGASLIEEEELMIVRSWSARATCAGADAYERHFRSRVLPALSRLQGQLGAELLRHDDGDDARLRVLSYWESMDAVRSFSGDDVGVAIVEDDARAALTSFDDRAEHFEIVVSTRARI
jgi:heme-degrading monooxygenase HmoA